MIFSERSSIRLIYGVGTIWTPTTIYSGDLASVTLIAMQALRWRTVSRER